MSTNINAMDYGIENIYNDDLSEDLDLEDVPFDATCMYKSVIHPTKSRYVKNKEVIAKENRITKPRMTKYEHNRILGERTVQILGGAKPLVKGITSKMSAKEIVELELKYNMVPFKVFRELPNGSVEEWLIEELKRD